MRQAQQWITTALLCLATTAQAAEWVGLGQSSSAEISYASGGIHHHDGIATAWMRQIYVAPQDDKSTEQRFDRSESRHIFDCKSGTSGVMQGNIYLKGELVNLISLPFEMAKQTLHTVPANSMIQQLMNVACAQPEAPFRLVYEPAPGTR